MKRWASTGLVGSIALAAIAVLFVALGSNTRAATVSSGFSAADATSARSVPAELLVWVTPDEKTTVGDVMYSNGAVYARTTDTGGKTVVSDLGAGTTARLIEGGENPVLLVQTYDSESRLIRYDSSTASWDKVGSLNDEVAATCGGLKQIDIAMDGSPGTVGTLSTQSGEKASEVSSGSCPLLSPDPTSLDAYQASGDLAYLLSKVKLTTGAEQGRVTALVRGGESLFAFSCTGLAAAVTNVTTGQSSALSGYSWVDAAGLGGDGYVYAAVDSAGRGTPLHVLRIDPETLTVLADENIGWATNSASGPSILNEIDFVPTSSGAVLFASETTESESDQPADHVWKVAADGVQTVDVPKGLGCRVGYGKDGSLLLYCLPAGNQVTRLSLSSGETGAASGLNAPEGSYVVVAAE